MNADTFLEKVLPDTGYYCLFAAKNGKIQQTFADTTKQITAKAKTLLKQKHDLYFATGSFETPDNRKASNVLALNSFFLDIDCGEDKPYKTKHEGLLALKEFCNHIDLPVPTLVDSGNGYHVYWALDAPTTPDLWRQTAGLLKAACAEFTFHADPVVTTDMARILRLPGTTNFKDPNNQKSVVLRHEADSIQLSDFAIPLKALNLNPEMPKQRRTRDATTDALAGNIQHSFAAIARKSIKGNGCAQLKYILTKPGDISEPLWRSGLSIAAFCKDWEPAIYKMSEGHAGYDRTDTREKALAIPAPHKCSTFRTLNPELCKKCKLKVSTPISIDKRLDAVDAPKDKPKGNLFPSADVIAKGKEKKAKPADARPPLPKGYEFGRNGGIYRQVLNDDGSHTPKLVYRYDIYPVERMHDANLGQCVIVRVVTPHDPDVDFPAPMEEILLQTKGIALMRRNGVIVPEVQYKELLMYMEKAIEYLQKLRAAKTAHLQYGWTDNDKSFIIGNREYLPDGVKRNFQSSATADTIDMFAPKGDLVEWRKAIDVYRNPKLKPQAFTFLAGFGSPLMHYTKQVAAVVNLMSTESGTGKSTAGQAALSIWGDPRGLILSYNDTSTSRVHRIGLMRNLPIVMDEMTNITAEDVSDLLFTIASGRDRNRMQRHTNAERINKSQWNLLVLTNSNSSMMDKVATLKSTPDGEAARLLEFAVKEHYIEGAEEKFALMSSNYGVAGDIYARWLVKHRDELDGLVAKERANIIKLAGTSNKERYWVSGMATTMAGGRIAKTLGLHDIDMDELEIWAVQHFASAREVVENHSMHYNEVIGEFLHANTRSVVAVNGENVSGLTGSMVSNPLGGNALKARIEPEINMLWINKTAFRDYCASRQITSQAALDAANGVSSDYAYVGTVAKRMFSSIIPNVPTTQAYLFKMKPETLEEITDEL